MLARRREENTLFVPFSTERRWRGMIIPFHTTPAPKAASDFPRLGRTCGLIAVEPEQGRRDEEMTANKVCLTQAAKFREDSGVHENFALPSIIPVLTCIHRQSSMGAFRAGHSALPPTNQALTLPPHS